MKKTVFIIALICAAMTGIAQKTEARTKKVLDWKTTQYSEKYRLVKKQLMWANAPMEDCVVSAWMCRGKASFAEDGTVAEDKNDTSAISFVFRDKDLKPMYIVVLGPEGATSFENPYAVPQAGMINALDKAFEKVVYYAVENASRYGLLD